MSTALNFKSSNSSEKSWNIQGISQSWKCRNSVICTLHCLIIINTQPFSLPLSLVMIVRICAIYFIISNEYNFTGYVMIQYISISGHLRILPTLPSGGFQHCLWYKMYDYGQIFAKEYLVSRSTLFISCLTHWNRDKMTVILQTRFWKLFSWLRVVEFWLKFHLILCLRAQRNGTSLLSYEKVLQTIICWFKKSSVIWNVMQITLWSQNNCLACITYKVRTLYMFYDSINSIYFDDNI